MLSRAAASPNIVSGLWNDAQRDRLAAIAASLRSQGAVPGIQLAHAGRKGSVSRPWEGTLPPAPANDGAWEVLGALAPALRGRLCASARNGCAS